MVYRVFDPNTQTYSYTSVYPEKVMEKIQDALVHSLVVLQHKEFITSEQIIDTNINSDAVWVLLNLLKDIRFPKYRELTKNGENQKPND